jgi:hypothetical protein
VGSQALYMTSMAPVNRLSLLQLDKRLLTRFRAVQYMNKWTNQDVLGVRVQDPETGGLGTVWNGELVERNPDSMFDGYGALASDVYYEAGDFIKIKSSTRLDQVYIGYLSDPLVEPVTSINSWIARDYPNLIAAAVKMRMFSDMGKQDELRTAGAELQAEQMSLLSNNIKLSARK